MKFRRLSEHRTLVVPGLIAAFCLVCAMWFQASPAKAAPGDVTQTLDTPMELPVEIEVETGIASLKQAPLWKELYQLLENPYLAPVGGGTFGPSGVVRRPGFGVAMPALNAWPLDYNFLTGQTLRLRTSDGEVSWDQPGPLFDPDEAVATSADPARPNVPVELRTVIGALVGSDDDVLDAGEVDGSTPCTTCGYLIVSNPEDHDAIPPNGTVVAVPAVVGGVLQELDGVSTTDTVDLDELEIPINEEDFLKDREIAEVLGKALFWDMQVGSDGIQACGTCHFHAGVDNRTRNQLNPNHLGGDLTLQVHGPNEEVVAEDFPFHKLEDPEVAVEATSCGLPGLPPCPPGLVSDANDVMSSMGVRFREFVDIPTPGPTAFGPAVNGVAPLLPDIGVETTDPIPDAFVDPVTGMNLRRVEPRNTPTFHAAAFNFDNFWDGRARFLFNGGSVFGPSDPQFHVFIDDAGTLAGATNGHFRDDLAAEDPVAAAQPVRIKFSSLASQAVGPPLSEFEMSFLGRNWPKIGKKLLQANVTPLANQLVDPDDSVLGPYSGQRTIVGGPVNRPGRPGLNITYPELIQLAFNDELWSNTNDQFLQGTSVPMDQTGDPFDGYVLSIEDGQAAVLNTDQFTQMEANFSLFFALAVQAYEELTIPDDTPFDRFMDANPLAANGVGQPGEQGVLFPTLVPGLVGGGLTLIPDDPATAEYDGFGPEEVFGMDIFMGANLTAALPAGSARNPAGFGSNPFARAARCMLCHLGPEQTDHSINIAHGIIKGDAEFEFPTPPEVLDPTGQFGMVPAPEPPGPIAAVGGLILSEEVAEGAAQDAVEVEPRNFATFDDPATPWDDAIVAQPRRFSFGDQGIYNIGLRPNSEDIGRGGDDVFGWPLSLSALTLKNIGGQGFEPGTVMANFDPNDIGAEEPGALQGFEETGDGAPYPGTLLTLQSINPGFERDPIDPQLPAYMAPWMHSLPAGELHPQIDEMAGFLPNVVTPPNGGPAIEFPEVIFGADLHCGTYDPAAFGSGPPNFGWGATDPVTGDPVPGECPNNQSGVPGNLDYPVHGSWPLPNQVLKDGAFKAPSLRNVELTGPYFHTGSYLTLRQVVDFYMRGGDFPMTNADDRDPHILEIEDQAFGFGSTLLSDIGDVAPGGTPLNGFTLIGTFADALPDTDFQYSFMPDAGHLLTPEYATVEDAKNALVKFLLALTDPRVKYEKAPFDHPEIFVPLDGTAPDNINGRDDLLANPAQFKHVAAVGADGNAVPLSNFLGVASTPGPGVDHFDSEVPSGGIGGAGGAGGAGGNAGSGGGGSSSGCFINTVQDF